MWRISLLALLISLAGQVWAGPEATALADSVAVAVTLRGPAVSRIDITFPAQTPDADIDRDLQQVTRWTGWSIGRRELRRTADAVSCRLPLAAQVQVEGCLSDVVWPMVAALSGHTRVGIMILGGPAMAGGERFENRYVVLEPGGGQGVLYYTATIKNSSFANLAELMKPDVLKTNAQPVAGGLALAWLLLIVAAVAVGCAAYFGAQWLARSSRKKATSTRRRR